MMYSIDSRLRTLSTLRNTLPDTLKEALHKWTQDGQLGFLFDNPEDTLTFSRFQCIEFEGMEKYPQLIEPLLFYLLHRANAAIEDDQRTGVLKAFIVDEAWVFFRNATITDVEIGPGDLLFLPVGWWHHVLGLEISITMTFTNFVFDNDFYSFYRTYQDI